MNLMKLLLSVSLIATLTMVSCGGEEGDEEGGAKEKEICLTVGGKEKCVTDAPGNYGAEHISGDLSNNFGVPKDREARVVIYEIAKELKTEKPESFKGKSYNCDIESSKLGNAEGLTFTIKGVTKFEVGAHYLLSGKITGEMNGESVKGKMTVSAPVGSRIEK